MKKFLLTLICAIVFLVPHITFAGLADHPVVAVLPYANKAAVSKQLSLADASLVSEFVVEKLLDSGHFSVVTRDKLLEVTQEQGLQAGSLVNPNTSMMMGKIAGAQYLVAGSVTGLSAKVGVLGYENSVLGSADGNKNTVIANLTLHFIDVETGLIVMAVSGTGESSSTYAEFTLNQTKQLHLKAQVTTNTRTKNTLWKMNQLRLLRTKSESARLISAKFKFATHFIRRRII